MEASSAQQQKEREQLMYRPYAFEKMEGLVREMQDPETGVPVRSQKQFLTSIPSAFMGYDLIEWLMERLGIEESVEAVHIANQLCLYGYFFPVNDSKTLTIKDDSSLYRFQIPYYWPRQHKTPDNVEYAIYLAKRTLRNKQRHALEDYEIEALNSLKKNLQNKWDIIHLQAEEQVRLSKERKKGDKIVSDSQERAFWRVYRPPPGCLSSLEAVPVPTRARPGLPRAPPRKRTLTDLQREVKLLENSLTRTRIKVSVAIENLKSHFETYMEYDPMIAQPQPSNPWITDDQTFWQLNSPLVEVPTEKRVKRWAISMEEVMSDPTGLQEFTNYLRKEYSHENIRFWLAVKDLRHSTQAQISNKVNEIFREFLSPGAPCEINIDGKTMERVHQEMKNVSRFTFDAAAEHVYTLLLKKDCYPRFIRSDHYRNLLAAGVQPLQKKRFFRFGGQAKNKISTTTAPMAGSLQQQHAPLASTGNRRRGSDRSLSGSAHELAICGVRDVTATPHVPHSHSQSNLTDIPYRGDLARFVKIPSRPSPRCVQDAGAGEAAGAVRLMDDVCPWDSAAGADTEGAASTVVVASVEEASASHSHSFEQRTSRKNSTQMDSCSSSSDISSVAILEVSEHLRKSSTASSQDRATITRNFSVGSSVMPRVKLSDTIRASSSCNYPSPQHSFDLSYSIGEKSEGLPRVKTVPEESEHMEPKASGSGRTQGEGKAPLISISAIVGDLAEEGTVLEDQQAEAEAKSEDEQKKQLETEVSAKSEAEEAQVVPVWEPDAQPGQDTDAEADANAAAAAGSAPQEKRDNKVNEVCPWEDEENCRVDAPYVKTYATLGYL